MVDTAAGRTVPVVVFYENDHRYLNCDRQISIAQLRDAWYAEIGASPSVSFFTPDERCVPDDKKIIEVLENSKTRCLQLYAHHRSVFWVEVFGYEDSLAQFEVATILTPASVHRDIGRAVGIFTDDFRLFCEGAVLDTERPFNTQGLTDGAHLTLDLRLTVNVHVEQVGGSERRTLSCFGSDTIVDLRRELGLGEDSVLVTISPYRRVLSDSLRLCHVVSDMMDLHVPLDLTAEKKVLLSFEPIHLPNLRQQLLISLSSTPLDIYETLSERFDLATGFRLLVNDKELNKCEPLIEQLLDKETVIQLDILRPCEVKDQWIDLEARYDDEVYLYTTESPQELYLKNFIHNQRLAHDWISLSTFDSLLDAFGPVNGRHRSVLLVDRDIERHLSVFSFDTVVQRLTWAKSMLLDVTTSPDLHPKEVMCYESLAATKRSFSQLRLTGDSLIVLDPLKVFVSSKKKLSMSRFANGSTYGDVRARMQQMKGSIDVRLKVRDRLIPDEKLNRRLDLELYFLESASRFQTKATVSMNGTSYGCWFEQQQVSFSDIMVSVGRQANSLPRHLFSHKLYCRGCGRQLSKEEEPHQMIPVNCCQVKSLCLTDRRVKEVGIQTAVARNREVATNTSDPESKDMPRPLLQVWATDGEGKEERKTIRIKGDNGRALRAGAAKQLEEVLIDKGTVMVFREKVYDRNGEHRRALMCLDKSGWNFFDAEDGSPARGRFSGISRHILHKSSLLPIPPGRTPIIRLQSKVEFLTTTSQRQIQAAPRRTSLADPAFVTMITGIRSGEQFYWDVHGGLIDAESGEFFMKQEDVPTGASKRWVILLLRGGDCVPRIAVPWSKTLVLLKRQNTELQVQSGRVRPTKFHSISDTERWDEVKYADDFYTAFVKAALEK